MKLQLERHPHLQRIGRMKMKKGAGDGDQQPRYRHSCSGQNDSSMRTEATHLGFKKVRRLWIRVT